MAVVVTLSVAGGAPSVAGAGTRVVITPDRPIVPDLPLGRGSSAPSHARMGSGRTFAHAATRGRRAGATPAAAAPVWTVPSGFYDAAQTDSSPSAPTGEVQLADASDSIPPADAPVRGVRALIGAEPVAVSDQASVVEVGVTDGPSLGEGAFILLVNRGRGAPRGAGFGGATLPASPWAGQDPLTCMTQAVYFEARGEPLEGQEGVAQVVMNRTHLAHYSSDVCGVVFQGAERTTGCQFSFTCDGAMNRPLQADAWGRAQAVAEHALDGFVYEPLRDATHFHAGWVTPYWSSSLTRVKQIGGHIFYR